jgi:hypothetical protein
MAFEAYIRVTSLKGGSSEVFPGTVEGQVKDLGLTRDEGWSGCISYEYRIHGTLESQGTAPSGARQHEPFRATIEGDGNLARYMDAICTNTPLKVELVFVANKNGKLEKELTLILEGALLHEYCMSTGKPQLGSSPSARAADGKPKYDTRDLLELAFKFEKIKMESGLSEGGVGKVAKKAVAQDQWNERVG